MFDVVIPGMSGCGSCHQHSLPPRAMHRSLFRSAALVLLTLAVPATAQRASTELPAVEVLAPQRHGATRRKPAAIAAQGRRASRPRSVPAAAATAASGGSVARA